MPWSKFQSDIFEAIDQTPYSLRVEAVAGSGKTTTLVEAMQYVHPEMDVAFLAFNKSIADSLRDRVPEHVHASTFNSLGFKIMREYHQSRTDPKKVGKILQDKFSMTYKDPDFWTALKLISIAKANLLGVDEYRSDRTPLDSSDHLDQWHTIMDRFDILFDREESFRKARRAYARSMEDKKTIDFDDQIFLPVLYNLRGPRHDVLFVDECQDLSPLQIRFLSLLRPNHGALRVIAVGDSHQAIYGFRGADSAAMQTLMDLYEMRSLPLSISYRCSKQVVAEAQRLVPHIQPASSAPEGEVDICEEFPDITRFTARDMILCPFNAPLFRLATRMILSGVQCEVWSNSLAAMKGFISSFKTREVSSLKQKLSAWREKEIERLEQMNRRNAIGTVEDKYNSVLALIPPGATQVSSVLQNVEKMLNSKSGAVISTVHKAKGTERENVYLMEASLPPHIEERMPPWAFQQRKNLEYVAITRAEQRFFRIPQDVRQSYFDRERETAT